MKLADESSFRLVFGFFWLLSFAVRIYFQAKARNPQKSLVRHERRAKLGFRLLAIAYLLLIMYPATTWFDFAHLDLPSWFRWTFGTSVLCLYLALFASAHLVLGKHWSGLLEIHEDHALITAGPYRLMRHPMYSAFFLSGIGFFFLSANWFISALYLLAVAFMYSNRVSAEEDMMNERFGDSYREYEGRTGRLVPRFHRPRSSQSPGEGAPPEDRGR